MSPQFEQLETLPFRMCIYNVQTQYTTQTVTVLNQIYDTCTALYNKRQSHRQWLRSLGSSGECRTLLGPFRDTVVVSAGVCCFHLRGKWKFRDNQGKKLNKSSSSVLECPLDSTGEVRKRSTLATLTPILDTSSHPLHGTVGALKQLHQKQTAQ